MWAFGGCRAAAIQAEPDAREPVNTPMRLRRNAGICLSSGNPLKRCGTLAKVLVQPKAQLDCRVMGMSRHSDESADLIAHRLLINNKRSHKMTLTTKTIDHEDDCGAYLRCMQPCVYRLCSRSFG